MEGGVGAFTQELAKALNEQGHELHIITNRRARPPSQNRRARNLLEPVTLPFARLHPRIRHWRWSALTTIVDIVLRYELDLVNIQYQAAAYNMRNPAINFLPWRLRRVVKTAVTFHDLRVPYLFPKAGRWRETAVRFMAKQAHGVIVTNESDFAALHPILPAPLCRIPIGSNITTYRPTDRELTEVRQRLGLKTDDMLLGYFGFLNASKGADILVGSLCQLPPSVHLVFIGGQTGSSDPDNNQSVYEQLQQQIKAEGLEERVHWTGFVSDQEVATYLEAADLMVMPYRDGVSLRRGTLMAVLAQGRPLLTTQPTAPTPELVHGSNVWLVPPDDAMALAAAVQQLLADKDQRSALGQGAARIADLFTWNKIADQTADFYRKILSG